MPTETSDTDRPGQGRAERLDRIDRRILAELQADARITNVELARRAGLSPPPCLRRVRALEERGLIRGYHADLDPARLGLGLRAFATVGLARQSEGDLAAFEALCRDWPIVRACHLVGGGADYVLDCAAPDLDAFHGFVTGVLTAAPNVASVRTSLVMRTAKAEPGVPVTP